MQIVLGAHRTLLLLLAALIGVGALRMFFGATFGWPAEEILPHRGHRLAMACIVGVGLSVGGVGLQNLLRNPLAEPFLLGLSTGAGVGVMLQLLAGKLFGWTVPIHFGALCGAVMSLTIVYLASRRHGIIDPLGLLLVGVVLGTINGGIIMFLNFVPGSVGLRPEIAQWMMGHLNQGASLGMICVIGGITVAGFIVLLWYGSAMDVATFSDAEAESLGVHLGRLRFTLFIVSSVLAAAAVALAGPIAFVGLICPHMARLMLGPQHRPLLIGAALTGAMLMVLADMTSYGLNLIFRWGLMPLGIFTAILGGVCFLWILRPQLGRG